jgi:glycosyltransferase involved in cell wall biosynthesis
MPFLNDKRVKYIEKANGGTASALNAGIRNSIGDYLVWLSSDDLFVEDKIQNQLLFMEKNNFHISYTNFSRINEKGVVTNERAAVHPISRKKLCIRLLKGCPINGSTIMMKREVYNKVGKFNEKLSCTQDYDYWLRTILQYNFGYLDEPLTLYRVHNQMGSIKHRTKLLNEANLLKRRYRPLLLRIINRL